MGSMKYIYISIYFLIILTRFCLIDFFKIRTFFTFSLCGFHTFTVLMDHNFSFLITISGGGRIHVPNIPSLFYLRCHLITLRAFILKGNDSFPGFRWTFYPAWRWMMKIISFWTKIAKAWTSQFCLWLAYLHNQPLTLTNRQTSIYILYPTN